ncbi:MAG: hypothetical protein QME75_00685 [Deltaproteobacteria bacterium]|nr:hypothetical protein [Deltaproteobacteria bacterium]
MKQKTGVLIFMPLLLGLFLLGNQPRATAAPPKLSQVVYVTLSQACGCILDRCKAGDWVVEKVFNGPRQSLLVRIDYSTEKDKAREYIKKYRITMPPAMIFLNAQGQELWRAMGDEVDYDKVQAKLQEFGA